MPYYDVGKRKSKLRGPHGSKVTETTTEESVTIFYQRYGGGPIKVLFIIGLAGTHESWGPQVVALCGADKSCEAGKAENGEDKDSRESRETRGKDSSSTGPASDSKTGIEQTSIRNGIEICTFDNRGAGRSSIPKLKCDYSTGTMAEDALGLLDHLGWDKAHVCGHSMGGMIACKLAASAPHRLCSLTLIGVTGGGYQCLPKLNRTSVSIAYRIYRANTPEERSAVDLDTHYTPDYLEATVGGSKRRALLFEEYVKNLSTGGMQPRYGLEGQVSACWNHRLTNDELNTIRSAGFLVAVVHGRGDVIAQVEHARKLAKKLHPVSRMIELPGGHLVNYQSSDEVNGVLRGVIRAVEMNVHIHELNEGGATMYDSKGDSNWQTVGGTTGKLEAAGWAQAAVSAVVTDCVKLLPEWLNLLHVFPSLYWAAKACGVHGLKTIVVR